VFIEVSDPRLRAELTAEYEAVNRDVIVASDRQTLLKFMEQLPGPVAPTNDMVIAGEAPVVLIGAPRDRRFTRNRICAGQALHVYLRSRRQGASVDFSPGSQDIDQLAQPWTFDSVIREEPAVARNCVWRCTRIALRQ
jgi:hypothetical protein